LRRVEEFFRRQEDAISRGCYDNSEETGSHASMCTTTPVRPMVDFSLVTRDVTVKMDKFNCQQAATEWYRELTKLVASRAKTHRGCVKLDTGA